MGKKKVKKKVGEKVGKACRKGSKKGCKKEGGKDRASSGRPVLVAVDFSPHSAAALAWAAKLCRRLDSPLRVLHVVHDPESAPGYYTTSKRKKRLRRIDEAAAEMMQVFLAEVAAQHPRCRNLSRIEPILVPGLPVTRVLEVAEQIDACLIAVGSQGRTGLPHLMLGSKAERIAQLSPLPVTIVKLPKG